MQQQSETSSPVSPGKTYIYIRRSNKEGTKIKVGQTFAINDLKRKIFKLFEFHPEDYALIYNGKRVDQVETLTIEEKSNVIHLIDLRNVNVGSQEMAVVFKEIEKPEQPMTLNVKTDKTVRSLLDEEVKGVTGKGSKQVFLVYLGKVLQNSKTLCENLVEENSQIFIVDLKKKARKDKFQIIEHSYQRVESPVKISARVLSPRKGDREKDDLMEWVNERRQIHNNNVEEGQKNKELKSLQEIPLSSANEEEMVPLKHEKIEPSRYKTYKNAAPHNKQEQFFDISETTSEIHGSENDSY